jgi:glycosyltransferase involved in cell wall biosynthesis
MPLRVAHVTTIALSQRLLLLNQLKAIRDAGYSVAGVSSPGDDARALLDAGIPHHAVGMTRRMTPLRDLRSVADLARLFRRERYSLVHTHNPKPAILGQLAARLAGVPVVMHTIHGFWWHEHMKPWVRQACIDADRVASSWSDLIFSQSAEDVETAIREKVAPAEKLVHIGNGIDVGRFRKDPLARARVRRELGIGDDERVVGFVGRLVEEKGLLELLEAATMIVRRVPRVRFVFVGATDDEKADSFQPADAARYGASASCIFTGQRDDVADLYNAFDVFALPSHREGLPRSPMEASSCGVPVVATQIRGCREAVVHGENGFLTPLKDVRALSEALLELLEDEALRARLGRGGERLARERFDEQVVFGTILDGYARVLQAKGLAVPRARQRSATRRAAA